MLHGRVSTSPPGGGRCSPTGQCSHLWEIHLAAPCPLPQKIRGGKSNQPESICPPPRGSLSPCTVLRTGQGADVSRCKFIYLRKSGLSSGPGGLGQLPMLGEEQTRAQLWVAAARWALNLGTVKGVGEAGERKEGRERERDFRKRRGA